MGMERRWGMRKSVEVEVVIDNQPVCLLRGRIDNISIGGLFVHTEPAPLRMNTPVELVLLLEDDNGTRVYRLPAVVVRITAEGAGLMFDQYDVNAFRTLVVLLLEQQKSSVGVKQRQRRGLAFATASTEDGAIGADLIVEGVSEAAREAAAAAPALQQLNHY